MMSSQNLAIATMSAVLLLLVVANEAVGFELKPCNGTVNPTPYTKFEVSACKGQKGERCELTAGAPFDVEIDFKTPKPFKVGIAHMSAVNYQDRLYACNHGIKCPSVAGDEQHLKWTTSIPVHNKEAKVAELELGIIDDATKKFLICYYMPALLSPAKKSTETKLEKQNRDLPSHM